MEKTKNDQKNNVPRDSNLDKNKEKKATKAKEKVYEGAADLKKLKEATMKKLANLAPDIETVPRARYTGYKFNGRLLSSIMGKKLSFDFSIHEYSEKGTHTSTEHFEIKSTSKDVSVVVAGLIKQVRKNYDILTAAKSKKVEPKKETFAEAKIVEEIPIIKTKKEASAST